ncbi:hypothetical protein NW766_011583 [Fusarium irregulare]|uniref:NACHT domain-containing protein n=1 Tax=Fusarium irregulare TaxID=2494466 RepID=A0A9W8PFK2_9HYPO|nr:hypothetical protein NW766_011583 [Fusarium irregulare]
MSDPLSMTASIAGLAALTAQVFKTMIDYGKAVKDARMDVGILTTELRTLSGMLMNLSLLATSLEASTSSNNFFSDFQLDHLKRTIKNLDVELAKKRSNFEANKFKSVVQKLKWPFSKDDMMKLVEEIRAHKATVNLALSADTLETLTQCFKAQEDTRGEVSRTRNAVETLQEMYSRVELNRERKKIYDYFLKINPQTQFEMTQQLRNIHTGGWFIEHGSVSDWMLQPNSKLWLTGIAGSGKTLLCGLLIERVLEICDADTVLAFFFCDYKDLETQVLTNMLSSIALQIALQKPEAFTKLQKYYNELHPESGLPRQVDVGKLTETITDMCQLFPKVFLIVDGLDECIDNTRENTRGLCQLVRSIPNLSIAVFSRREVEISSELVPDYNEMEISAQDQDLEPYIDTEMTKRPTLCGLPMEERDGIKKTLISKAKGMFRWVTCQLDCLEGLGRIGRETALNELPPTLDESYDRILIKVMSKRGRNIAQEIVRNTLHWVCYDSPGLTIAQICEALSIAFNRDRKGADKCDMVDEKEIMSYCSSLIRKNLEGDKFELAHFTVEEYLKGIDDESKLRLFKYSKADTERSLAQVSLEQIMSPSFASRPVAEMSEYEKAKQRQKDYPFYSYAVSHWPTVPNTHDDAAVRKLLRDLFTTRKRSYLQNSLIHLCIDFVEQSGAEDIRNEVTHLITLILRGDLTPLHIAAMIHSSSLCRWLLSKDINVNSTTFTDLAPIHFALLGVDAFHAKQNPLVETRRWCIKSGLPSSELNETINTLLDHDLKVPAVNRGSVGKLALDVCVRYGDASPFCTLLALFPEDCLDQDALDQIQATFQYPYLKHTVVHDVVQAIFNLDAGVDKTSKIVRALQFVSELVRSDGSWDTYDHDGDQFLPVLIKDADFPKYVWYTAAQDRAEDMSRLLDDPRFKDHFNPAKDINPRYDPLITAGEHDSAKVVRVLLQSGFDWLGEERNGDTVWHVAARADSVHVLQTLLELHKDIKMCLRAVWQGNTPVGDAMSYRRDNAANLLIGHCTNDPAFFMCKRNILECAVEMGSQEVFHALISKGVPSNTSRSISPLHFVNNRCSNSFIEELVQLYGKDNVSKVETTAFQEYIRVILHAADPIPFTGEQVTSRLKILAPTNHIHNGRGSENHIWRLFCKDLGVYGNQPRSAAQIQNIRKLLVGLTNAGITKSFETQGHGPSMTALFEELEVLTFNSGVYRWEDTALNDAYFLLRPAPAVMRHRSTIAFFTKAVRQGHYPTVRWLLARNTPVNIRINSIAPLEQACHTGSFQSFVEILEARELSLGDDLDLLCRLIVTAARNPAEDVNTMKKIRFGLDHGLSVDERVTSPRGLCLGYPAIVLAARLGRHDIVDLLMIRGADVFAEAPDRWDLVKYSIYDNRVHLFQQLHEKSRSISAYDWKACVTFNTTDVSPPTSPKNDELSVLHLAAAGGSAEIIDHMFNNDLVENVDRFLQSK